MSESGGETRELVRIHLRGGQTIELVTTDWGLNKHTVTNDLTSFRWTNADDRRMPYVRLDAIDAVTVHPLDQDGAR